MGVDTLLLAQGNAVARKGLLVWLRERVTDHSVEYETRGVTIWSWGGGGHLLVSSSAEAGRMVYSRMGAGGRLETLSARKR